MVLLGNYGIVTVSLLCGWARQILPLSCKALTMITMKITAEKYSRAGFERIWENWCIFFCPLQHFVVSLKVWKKRNFVQKKTVSYLTSEVRLDMYNLWMSFNFTHYHFGGNLYCLQKWMEVIPISHHCLKTAKYIFTFMKKASEVILRQQFVEQKLLTLLITN